MRCSTSSLDLDAKLLDGDGRECLQALAPLLGREVKIFRANQVADQAALVRLVRPLSTRHPCASESCSGSSSTIGRVGQQIEEAFPGAGDGGIQLPSGKDSNAGGANGLLDQSLRFPKGARRTAAR